MFDLSRYSPAIAALLDPGRVNPLGPGVPNESIRQQLAGLTMETAFPNGVVDRQFAQACLAGLWLHHDFLDESHEISQSLPNTTGSFWHGIMHRREPDASNAKYWFHRVGSHPVFAELAASANELGLQINAVRWDPFHFIDLCEKHRGTGSEQELLLRQVQQREWELLFDWCYERATSAANDPLGGKLCSTWDE